MNILILSDSHGYMFNLEQILQKERSADMIIHLGDGADDMMLLNEYTYGKLVYSVKGNCDSGVYGFADSITLPIEGVTVFGCHGHAYGVKYGLQKLFYAAKQAGASLCLYGHTHCARSDIEDGMYMLNPGAVAGGCYATVQIKNGTVKTQLKTIQ